MQSIYTVYSYHIQYYSSLIILVLHKIRLYTPDSVKDEQINMQHQKVQSYIRSVTLCGYIMYTKQNYLFYVATTHSAYI